MAEYRAPLEDFRFLLSRVFQIEHFWQSLDKPGDVDMDMANAILGEAAKIAQEVLAPLNQSADAQGCRWDEGEVLVPDGFKEAYQTFCEGGWNGLAGSPEFGGMGLPKTLIAPVEEMVQGACMAFGLAPMLTAGAAFAINAHANDELKARYLPKMYSGEWSGAMDLTEPHAGTDLGLIRTKAEPQNDGSYLLSGTKIFITWGEHQCSDNIIHLVLAKLPDAPAGSRGISLFLVPKFLVDAEGRVGERNQVSCGSIEHKMGIHASPTCVMNFDAAKGWLVGEVNKGLAAMFTMMNYERLLVGIEGIGVAEASYQSALRYARERLQGRSASGAVAKDSAADPLIVHADIRRMLLSMKALNEAGRAFYLYVAQFLDIAKFSGDAKRREQAEALVALLTPIAKAFITDMSLDATIHGQQIFGGHGYISEWGQEQHVRDVRITQIYEGTNGVQALDLIGRKTVACEGKLFSVFYQEVQTWIEAQKGEQHDKYIKPLSEALQVLKSSTEKVVANAKENPHNAGAVAVDYLHLFGYVAYAFMWARMAVEAQSQEVKGEFSPAFVEGKQASADFYFGWLLPQVSCLQQRVETSAECMMNLSEAGF